MRLMSPIASADQITSAQLLSLLQANFDRTLDGRYAIGQGVVMSAFLHPLASLTDGELRAAIRQVAALADNFGGTLSSGDLQFTGGKEGLNALITKGDSFFSESKFKESSKIFEEAISKFPNQPIPYFARGHALFAAAEFRKASQSLQKGLDLYPEWPNSGINLESFFKNKDLFENRLRQLESQVLAVPNDASLLFLQAYVQHFSGQTQKSRASFERLRDLDSGKKYATLFLPN